MAIRQQVTVQAVCSPAPPSPCPAFKRSSGSTKWCVNWFTGLLRAFFILYLICLLSRRNVPSPAGECDQQISG